MGRWFAEKLDDVALVGVVSHTHRLVTTLGVRKGTYRRALVGDAMCLVTVLEFRRAFLAEGLLTFDIVVAEIAGLQLQRHRLRYI